MSLSTEELETMLADLGTPVREPPAEAEPRQVVEEVVAPDVSSSGPDSVLETVVDVASLFDDSDAPPTVPALFPDWSDLFRRWPFVRLTKHPKHGEPLLLLGYAFRLEGGSIRLDNAKVGGVMFAKLTSICVPFSRSNDDDSQGLKVVVVKATQGTRVTLWRNTKSAEGRRTPDERHAELVVRDGKLVRLG
jgi:hypothetical protein